MNTAEEFLFQSQDLFFVLNKKNEIVKINPAFTQALGFVEIDIRGRSIFEIIHADDLEEFKVNFGQIQKNNTVRKIPAFRCYTKNKNWRWLQIQFMNMADQLYCHGVDVTENIHTRMMLEHQKRELSILVGSLDDLVIEVDSDFIFQNIWTSEDKMLFLPKKKMIGKKITEISDDFYQKFENPINQVIQNGGNKIVEYQDPQNAERWYAVKISSVFNAALNEKRRVLLSIRDATEKRKITQRKDELFRDLTEILEQAPVGLIKVSREGQVVLYNGRLLELFNITERNLKYLTFTELCNFLTVKNPDIIYQILDGTKSYYDGDLNLKINEENNILRLRISPIFDDSKHITHFMCIVEDITDQRNVQQALSESHNLFKVLTESSGTLILMFDQDGLCSYCNTPWLEYTKSQMSQQIGNGWNKYFHPDEVNDVLAIVKEAFINKKNFELQCQLARHDGVYRWFMIRGVTYYDVLCDFGGFIVTGIDIHDSKNQELKLLQTSKMASLGEMAGGIAHEINNPMAIILGNVQNLRYAINNGQADNNKVIEVCQRVENTCFRVAKIIQGLRSFSRSGSDDPLVIQNLRAIIDDTLSLCEERFKVNDVSFTHDNIPSAIIECRPVQISQVILNLLNNAFDAVQAHKKKWISLSASVDDGWVTIRVTDCGLGIEKDIRAKLMQPFFTTKPVGQGTGLGLSISKGIVESHRGTLVYDESSPNTSFVIRLPRA